MGVLVGQGWILSACSPRSLGDCGGRVTDPGLTRRSRQRRRRMIRSGPHEGRVPEGAWKTATRDVDLVETVKLQHTPGEARRPAPSPSPLREKRRTAVPRVQREQVHHEGHEGKRRHKGHEETERSSIACAHPSPPKPQGSRSDQFIPAPVFQTQPPAPSCSSCPLRALGDEPPVSTPTHQSRRARRAFVVPVVMNPNPAPPPHDRC